MKACAAGIGYLFALAFSRRLSALSSSLALFAICLLRPAPSSFLASLRTFPSHPQQSPPCLPLAIPATSSARNSSTWCVTSWDGPRRSSPGRSKQARAPSTTWSWGSSSSSMRTSPAGWPLRSPPSSFCYWRSSVFSSSTSPPTPSSSCPSSSTSWRCLWGCGPASPSSGISTPWSG
jgi:hypothetical protein